MTARDSRIFCRCGLMWNNVGVCPHCDTICPTRGCARCLQYFKQTDLDAHRGRINGT
ncbi:hypothetical protein [Arthrobacter sp. efr-133-TYG-118]|uniref:hypothetical protein n=1 Tax=Arthrobacter sp. efr-133-TYG-118 TaxID=3040279 RepID=UPI0025502CA8|nr:hypothetical protein [Arthrobacter sp. efr-133-TYG-118]